MARVAFKEVTSDINSVNKTMTVVSDGNSSPLTDISNDESTELGSKRAFSSLNPRSDESTDDEVSQDEDPVDALFEMDFTDECVSRKVAVTLGDGSKNVVEETCLWARLGNMLCRLGL
jgi:hypothetical protein